MVNAPETEGHGAQATPLARMAEITVKLIELALASADGNGGLGLTPDVKYTISRLALAAPATALRCPYVRSALAPETFALVTALAATPAPAQPPVQADSDRQLTAGEAARELGVSPQAVRGAAKRGTLPGRLGPDGRWHFRGADIETYGRQHGGKT